MDANTTAVWFAAIVSSLILGLAAIGAWAGVTLYEIKRNSLVEEE